MCVRPGLIQRAWRGCKGPGRGRWCLPSCRIVFCLLQIEIRGERFILSSCWEKCLSVLYAFPMSMELWWVVCSICIHWHPPPKVFERGRREGNCGPISEPRFPYIKLDIKGTQVLFNGENICMPNVNNNLFLLVYRLLIPTRNVR